MKKTDRTRRYILQEAGRKKEYSVRRFPEILVAFFWLAGFFAALGDLYYSDVCMVSAVCVSLVVFILLQILKSDEEKLKKAKTVIYIICLAVFVGMSIFIVQGILDLCNRVTILWNQRFHTELGQLSVRNTAGFGAIWMWLVIAIVIGMFVFAQMENRSRYGVMPVTIAVLFAHFVLEQKGTIAPVICLFVGMIGFLVLKTTESRPFSGIGSLYVIAGFGILAVITLAGTGYKPLESLENWKGEVRTQWEVWRYGEDSLPQGDLSKAAGLLDGDTVTLHLESDAFSELYLKGFVGGTYTGASWEPLSSDCYQGENEGILSWLEDRGFQPEEQYAEYNAITAQTLDAEPEYRTVSVQNENAYRKYLYLPASVSDWSAGKSAAEKDWQVQSKQFRGAFSYDFSQVKSAPMADDARTEQWLEEQSDESQQQYLESEAVYHSFVSENYTEINENVLKLISNTFFKDTKDLDFTETTKQIRKVLRENTTYTEHPGDVPENVDFIQWFLQDAKRGNAVAYATTAVMAYRAAGYPARYVEGYHLRDSEAQLLNGKTQVDLTTQNAHAWVEVYQAGIGWLPVEVVPGMYVEEYTNQLVAGQPAYEVNQSYDDSGVDTSKDGVKADQGSSKNEEKEDTAVGISPARVISVILIVLYVIFILYLVLEAQRALRLRQRKKQAPVTSSAEMIDQYLPMVYLVYKIRKVEGNSTNREDIWEQLQEKFPKLTYGEYRRILKLIEKVKFGEKELSAYEKHALASFYHKLVTLCYESSNRWCKLMMRYYYCFELSGGHELW